MEEAKISLSPSEFELVTNGEIILTKNRVLQKIQDSLGHLGNQEQDYLKTNHLSDLPELQTAPKISKGENYMGLPYVILDYPRHSTGEDFFFIRQMFWWGKFFSCTLQVKGKYKKPVLHSILNGDHQLSEDYFIGIHNDPWQHHFEPDNYKSIANTKHLEIQQLFESLEYIKIARSWPLGDYAKINELLFKSWNYLLNISRLIA